MEEWEFTPKFRWSLKNHMLSGICFGAWIKFLWRYRKDVNWFRYGHRIAFLSFMSIFNSLMSIPDYLFYEKKVHQQKVNSRPVFILGHPRTGTTHLHNLLSLDRDQFTYCNTFQVGFPGSFLCAEKVGSKLLAGILDETRPMDNMKLSFQIPQEDELAVNVLSSGCSPYMPLVLPESEKKFRPYYNFEGCSREDFDSWLNSFE